MKRITSVSLNSALSVSPINTFTYLITEWIDYQRQDAYTAMTIRGNSNKIEKFHWWWSHFYGETLGEQPTAVTVKEARAYVAYLKTPTIARWGQTDPTAKQELAPDSVLSYGRVVKAFFNWLESQDYLESSPFNHKSVSFNSRFKTSRVLKTVDTPELVTIFKYLRKDRSFTGQRNLAIVALLLDSGIRRGELIALKRTDVDLSNRSRCLVSGKTGTRYAHFSEVCRQALISYMHNSAFVGLPEDCPLWITIDRTPLQYHTVEHIFRLIQKHTGIHIHPHKLRHTFASMMAASGADAFVLKELLGHESVATTEMYVKLNEKTLANAQQAGSPLAAVNSETVVGFKRRGRPKRS